jgi:hypothetical protein
VTDTITLLRCARGLNLCKTIRDGEVIPYDQARTFDGFSRQLAGLDDLHELLGNLIDAPRFCVVRGELVAGGQAFGIRRLVYSDPQTGDAPTLRDVPRRWLALDIEGIERPPEVAATDLKACAAMAGSRLPEAFHRAACVAQATAGHGIKPGIRLRLWYWLSRAAGGAELKRWLKGSPADPSIFSAGQPIYTAAPLFQDGLLDHLPERITRLPGDESAVVPSVEALAPPAPPPAKPLPEPGSDRAQKYAIGALRAAAVAVATAPVDSRHITCRGQSRGLARLVKAGLLAGSDVVRVMDEALVQAGKPAGEGAKVAAWALTHPSTSKLPEGIS